MNLFVIISIILITIALTAIILIATYTFNCLTGYASKTVCSFANICNQRIEDIKKELIKDSPLLKLVKIKYCKKTGEVNATVFGMFKKTAIYRPPYGSVLVFPGLENKTKTFPKPRMEKKHNNSYSEFAPTSKTEFINYKPYKAIIDYSFSEPDDEFLTRETKAVLAIHEGNILFEKYADGLSKDTSFPGWSMSKSILNILVGMRSYEEKIDIQSNNLFKEWKNDIRSQITVEDLLRMESGLKWQEHYNVKSDAINMLYNKPDAGKFAASFKRVNTNNNFNYSSGSSNIISLLLRKTFISEQEYVDYIWNSLLLPLGLNNAQLEFDANGTWVASSFLFATARQWASFGKLILDNGMLNDKRVFSDTWLSRSFSPGNGYFPNKLTGNKKGLAYGMQWWLNRKDYKGENWMKDVPEDAISAIGHLGQYLTVIPSKKLIFLRMGQTRGKAGWDHNYILKNILELID